MSWLLVVILRITCAYDFLSLFDSKLGLEFKQNLDSN